MNSNLTTNEIRNLFLDFFTSKNHKKIPSASLLPKGDDTLLFVNAGMVPFKNLFLGSEKENFNKATSSQKCIRAGGKHNDLENVGYTARHHTFFEMLGNFSFGDYFKKEAIFFAWEFLTEVLKIPTDKLFITVYEKDLESEKIWLDEIKIEPKKLARIGEKDNFWSMGDTGPCGPCTEIFYDHGEDIEGGIPGSKNEDGDRYIEIWNLVFMQYNRLSNGDLSPLEKPSIDTGMGLERLVAVLQNVHSNYEIDLFVNIINGIAKTLNITNENQSSLKVIADHIRSCAFLIADGVIPGNEGRGYVLRRIIRRAIRHGHKLGANDIFFYKLVSFLVIEMGESYPELIKNQSIIENNLKNEEIQFNKTIVKGIDLFKEYIADLNGDLISGEIAFKMYDTYGFPIDLTIDMARENSFKVEVDGFDRLMKIQKNNARKAGKFAIDYNTTITSKIKTNFLGYDNANTTAIIKEIYSIDGKSISKLKNENTGIIILDNTTFYAESGGQASDYGFIELNNNNKKSIFIVEDVQKTNNAILHFGKIQEGVLSVNDNVNVKVETENRLLTSANHTTTHLLHSSLRKVLGDSVVQKGSVVTAEKLRFDFSFNSQVSKEELQKVEKIVNFEIRKNNNVLTNITDIENAKKLGAMALFGEKYGNEVRVLSISDFSVELCGGTHISKTGDIGYFKIISESSVSSGVRRIEAITGELAGNFTYQKEVTLENISNKLKTNEQNILMKIDKLINEKKSLEMKIDSLNKALNLKSSSDNTFTLKKIKDDIVVYSEILTLADSKTLRVKMDELKNKYKKAIIILVSSEEKKVSLLVGVTKTETSIISANNLIKQLAPIINAKGGGRADMAQAGGDKPEAINEMMNVVMHKINQLIL